MLGKEGRFHSPHYPGDYSSGDECIYTMVAEDTLERIEINFETFHLQESANCEKDYVQIYDGDSTNSRLMYTDIQPNGRFCGTHKPPFTFSSSKVLTVRFHSDKNITESGFVAFWKKAPARKG